MAKRKYNKNAEETAQFRMEVIAPLLQQGIDRDKLQKLVTAQSEKFEISERSVKRFLDSYQLNGYKGLYPKERTKPAKSGAITNEIMEAAIMLRREVPKRSIETIIKILEMEEIVEEGVLKRTTLQENLAKYGYSAHQMKMYSYSPTIAARRFTKKRRMQLVHSDIKYGPYLPIGPGGKRQQVYLVVFLDDASRSILHAQFYSTLDQTIIQDSLRMVILKFGLMEAVFFDYTEKKTMPKKLSEVNRFNALPTKLSA